MAVTSQVFVAEETKQPFECVSDPAGTDCDFWEFYFSPESKVVAEWACVNDDSTTLWVGEYAISDSALTCNFYWTWSFPSTADDGNIPAKPNEGVRKNLPPSSITILPNGCPVNGMYFCEKESGKCFTTFLRTPSKARDFIKAIRQSNTINHFLSP